MKKITTMDSNTTPILGSGVIRVIGGRITFDKSVPLPEPQKASSDRGVKKRKSKCRRCGRCVVRRKILKDDGEVIWRTFCPTCTKNHQQDSEHPIK